MRGKNSLKVASRMGIRWSVCPPYVKVEWGDIHWKHQSFLQHKTLMNSHARDELTMICNIVFSRLERLKKITFFFSIHCQWPFNLCHVFHEVDQWHHHPSHQPAKRTPSPLRLSFDPGNCPEIYPCHNILGVIQDFSFHLTSPTDKEAKHILKTQCLIEHTTELNIKRWPL